MQIDPFWNDSTYHVSPSTKVRYWSTFFGINMIGTFLTFIILISIGQLRKRYSSDILSGGVCFGAIIFSICSTIESLLNLIQQDYFGGSEACYIEAMIHTTSVMAIFLQLAIMAYDSHRLVTEGVSLTTSQSFGCILLVWFTSSLGVGLFSIISPVGLVPSGTFCFFKTSSILVYAFITPIFFLVGGTMAYYYTRIYQLNRSILDSMVGHTNDDTQLHQVQRQLVQKLLLFVGVFFLSWSFTIVAGIWSAFSKDMHQLDAIAGVFSSLHSIAAPVAYGALNPRIRRSVTRLLTCRCSRRSQQIDRDLTRSVASSKIATVTMKRAISHQKHTSLRINLSSNNTSDEFHHSGVVGVVVGGCTFVRVLSPPFGVSSGVDIGVCNASFDDSIVLTSPVTSIPDHHDMTLRSPPAKTTTPSLTDEEEQKKFDVTLRNILASNNHTNESIMVTPHYQTVNINEHPAWIETNRDQQAFRDAVSSPPPPPSSSSSSLSHPNSPSPLTPILPSMTSPSTPTPSHFLMPMAPFTDQTTYHDNNMTHTLPLTSLPSITQQMMHIVDMNLPPPMSPLSVPAPGAPPPPMPRITTQLPKRRIIRVHTPVTPPTPPTPSTDDRIRVNPLRASRELAPIDEHEMTIDAAAHA